jgi:hypothetical protein
MDETMDEQRATRMEGGGREGVIQCGQPSQSRPMVRKRRPVVSEDVLARSGRRSRMGELDKAEWDKFMQFTRASSLQRTVCMYGMYDMSGMYDTYGMYEMYGMYDMYL